MPGPYRIVAFIDADGDEFPIRVEGAWMNDEARLMVAARERLQRFVDHHELRPGMPISGARVET